MAKGRQPRKDWEGLIERWRASGMSMLAYCRERHISYTQLVRWRRRLEGETASQPLTLIPMMPKASNTLVVRLPGGVAIEVQRGFDPGLLAAVVQALGEPRRC